MCSLPEHMSGYTPCACRDCFDLSISTDTSKPELCLLCKNAGCEPVNLKLNCGWECQRQDAYGTEEDY